MMLIRQRWHQPRQSACLGVIVASARMVFLVLLLWTDQTTTAPSGHEANGRGGICYILKEIEWTGIVEVGHPLVCGWSD